MANKSVNTHNEIFGFNYSEHTRVANVIPSNLRSRRNKIRPFNCDVQIRAMKQKIKLQTKMKLQQKRNALEKLVAEHHRKKTQQS